MTPLDRVETQILPPRVETMIAQPRRKLRIVAQSPLPLVVDQLVKGLCRRLRLVRVSASCVTRRENSNDHQRQAGKSSSNHEFRSSWSGFPIVDSWFCSSLVRIRDRFRAGL